jgi:hypothetical protein
MSDVVENTTLISNTGRLYNNLVPNTAMMVVVAVAVVVVVVVMVVR